jgi:hypothetical protein
MIRHQEAKSCSRTSAPSCLRLSTFPQPEASAFRRAIAAAAGASTLTCANVFCVDPGGRLR